MKTVSEIAELAAAFDNILTLPEFETTVEQVVQTCERLMANGNATLDRIGELPITDLTFENTIIELDRFNHGISSEMGRLSLIKETSPSAEMREATINAIKKLEEWSVSLDYREDVYAVIQAYADMKNIHVDEDQRLLEATLRSYRRAGLHLPREKRDLVEKLRKELSALTTDFSSNIAKAKKSLTFTKAELDGVPDSLLNAKDVKTGEDEYTVNINVTWQYISIMDNARLRTTRERVLKEQHSLANEANIPLVKQILVLRNRIAKLLGYANWADYQIEVKMAKTGKRALEFEQDLLKGLQPKLEEELAEFRRIKGEDEGMESGPISLVDWRYYANQLKKQKYTVDAEQLRVYFPMDRVLKGMFRTYQNIFGLRFEEVEAPYKWVNDLQLWVVFDSETEEPLGYFYLDMFPRDGKYNHFAVFSIIDGIQKGRGKVRPVCALVCNFNPPTPDQPSLMSHRDVETLFHEFGHAMHSILTRSCHGRFSGLNVPGDFVEAPSQMLEAWVWNKEVLDSFAADYRDETKKIPEQILNRLQEAKYAVEASTYRRQLAFGLMDLVLHTQIDESNVESAIDLANKTMSEAFLPMPEGTALIAFFGHFAGYDASYYGYAWADAIAADMATVFAGAPNGFFDCKAGRALRDEIYAKGNSREIDESIKVFLGRERRLEPFLKKVGVRV